MLALTQTRTLCDALVHEHPKLSIIEVPITTEGDGSAEPLSATKNPGVFVSALRDALLEGRVDVIVHSMKDLPAKPHPEIVTACVPAREDARDGFVSRDHVALAKLPAGAVVGTSSPRRAATLRRLRPDVQVVNIRGNIDTRIEKVMRGDVDATLLAMAGLNRIGRADVVAETFDSHDFVPAPAQGALAVECRANDEATRELLRSLNDDRVQLVTTAERSVLLGLDAGCSTAVGAFAEYTDGDLILTAELAVEKTGEADRVRVSARLGLDELEAAEALGREAARQLLELPVAAQVARTLNASTSNATIDSASASAAASADCAETVLLIRANRNEVDAAALSELGIASVTDPYLSITSSQNIAGARRMLEALRSNQPTWLIATSTNALSFFEDLLDSGELEQVIRSNRSLRFAAIGEQTQRELEQRGAVAVVTPWQAYADSLADILVQSQPCRVVIPSGSIAMNTLNTALTEHGFEIVSGVVYNTDTVHDTPESVVSVLSGRISAVLFRSPSAVRAFHSFNGVANIAVFCAGTTTARQAELLGYTVTAISENPSPESVAHTIAYSLKAQS